MSKHLSRDLPELVTNNVISAETADRIQAFYRARDQSSPNRLPVVFGILGALLTGMGIVLIIAHNWDDLGKAAKLALAFLPLLIAQSFCLYSVPARDVNPVRRESAATFLFFSIAATISTVSQIYHIGGEMADFLFWWMALSLPVIYAMRSSMVSLLYLAGITWYACEAGYFTYPGRDTLAYWPFLIAVVPHYRHLARTPGNFFHFHSWFITLSLVIALGTAARDHGKFMTVSYMALLCALLLLGQMSPYRQQRLIANAFLATGSIGVVLMLLGLSFRDFWYGLPDANILLSPGLDELIVTIATTLLAACLLYRKVKSGPWREVNLKSYSFIVVIVLFAVGLSAPAVSVISINLLLFTLSVSTILDGARRKSFGILNYGLLILTALIACRFFDTDLSFVVRGLLFVAVGAGFFISNYYMARRKKEAP